jgi:hypothetical protein
MVVNIQINFTSGIGDFYTYFCEIYYVAKQLKENGHEVHLYFNSKRKVDFLSLFEPIYYQFFDKMEILDTPKSSKDFGDYEVVYPNKSWISGQHCWEMFFPINVTENYRSYYFNLSHPGLLNYFELSDFPKLSKDIFDKTKKFITDNGLNDFSVIHFREWDDIGDAYNSRVLDPSIDGDEFQVRHMKLKKEFTLNDTIMEQIQKISNENEKVFVCSNSIRVKTYVKEHFKNVFLYDDNILKTTKRDYSDEEYWNFCLIEFCLISMAKQINIFTNYSWISNFIAYGVFNNQFGVVNPYQDNEFVKNYGLFMKLN